jgi:hypothetical protein
MEARLPVARQSYVARARSARDRRVREDAVGAVSPGLAHASTVERARAQKCGVLCNVTCRPMRGCGTVVCVCAILITVDRLHVCALRHMMLCCLFESRTFTTVCGLDDELSLDGPLFKVYVKEIIINVYSICYII